MAEEKITNNTITIEGRKLLVNSLVNGVGIEFSHFGIGDGEAPAAPENLTALTHQLFTVPVSKTQPSDTEKGVTLVRGGFTNSNEKGDFYWRELGVYARAAGSQNEPVLFGYYNYGSEANYIPSVGMQSVIEQGIIAQIVTGSSTVIYISDPTAKATLQDIDECLHEVENKLEAFSQEHLNSIEEQINTLQKSITAATQELNKATEGYVLKAGDTMTGDLNMGENKLVGDVDGSASRWNGWRAFDSLEELNNFSGSSLTADSPVLDIINALPTKSRFIRVTEANTPFLINGQQIWGMMEIFKPANYFCELLISGSAGQRFRCSWDTTVGLTPWVSEIGTPAGIIDIYAGAEAPLGYLLCHGQEVSKAAYPALYTAIGALYGAETQTTFTLPDLRGVFLRGHDAGRGVDSGRKLGSEQKSGAPNITGVGPRLNNEIWNGEGTSGAIYRSDTPTGSAGECGDGNWWGNRGWNLDASRSSDVYQNGLNEVRPVNVAVNYIIKY